MLDVGLNTKVFQTPRDFPHVVTIFENKNGCAGNASGLNDRIVNAGYYNYYSGELKNFGKQKIVTRNALDCTGVNGVSGMADKLIRYVEEAREPNISAKDTQIYRGFVPHEFKPLDIGGCSFLPIKGAEKANYAILKRTLGDGDVVELTMKQAKDGKYEAIALKSSKGKTLADLPQVKELLLKLDPLVKRFIKVAK